MKTSFDFEKLFNQNQIENEMDLERALVAERKLRIMAKEDQKFEIIRKKLRDSIYEYEQKNWSNIENITEERIRQSDQAQIIVEQEESFLFKRKSLIRSSLKSLKLTQQDLGVILGHSSKTYMSELMNGICPFPLKDLIIIHKLLKIKMNDLVPVFLSGTEQATININLKKVNNHRTSPKLQPLSI